MHVIPTFWCLNREKSLRQAVMVAMFLDDSKPIKLLKIYSHYFILRRSYSVSFNLANLGEIFFGTVSISIVIYV